MDKVHTSQSSQSYSPLGLWLRKIWGKYSQATKGLHVTTYCYLAYRLFIRRLHKYRHEQDPNQPEPESRPRSKQLSIAREECLGSLLLQEQTKYLSAIQRALTTNGQVEPRYACWRPFLDQEGLIRINGRASHIDTLPFTHRHQVLMTKEMPLAAEIIKWIHEEELKHCGGARQLLLTARDKFWIENGLTVAKRVLKNCSVCRRSNAQEIIHQTGPLHKSRYHARRAFDSIGVDMFGPLETTQGRGRSRTKRYGIIFSCTFTRAINIEMAWSASAQSCFLAFRRHAASYGQPREINSDRGTNFQHVRTVLRELDIAWEDSQPLIKQHFPSITWNMNPPRTPSFGGHYESLIKTIKNVFKTLVKWPKYSLTDEELETSLLEAAAIANMRPLFDLSEDPGDELPLKPSDFLNAPILGSIPDEGNTTLTKKLRTDVETIRQQLWTRMQGEIIKQCNRLKQVQERQPLEKGDLVLLKTPDWRPDYWPLAQVVDVKPGQDGETRVVIVRHLHRGEAGDQVKQTLQSTRNLYRLHLPPQLSESRLL